MSKKERLIDDDLKKTKDTEALRELFYSKRTGLGGFDKLWRKVKKEGLDFTQREVSDFLSKQRTAQITKEFKKPMASGQQRPRISQMLEQCIGMHEAWPNRCGPNPEKVPEILPYARS